jgi:5-methylcytosine-specific restriction endonuclease McrA
VKTCSKCHRSLNLSDFSKRSDKPHLYRSWCSECEVLDNARWKRENPVKAAAVWNRYWSSVKDDPERKQEAVRRVRKWARANPSKAAEISRVRRARLKGAIVVKVDYDWLNMLYGTTCQLCKLPISTDKEFSWDHIIPLARGGPHATENLWPAHLKCNSRKGAR